MTNKLVWLIPIGALAIALTDMPYGYYMLLRVVICGSCIYLATRETRMSEAAWVWILGGCAVLYNPILRIHLGRDLWSVVNVATIALLTSHMWVASRRWSAKASN